MAKEQETDDDMARDHQEAWERTIQMLDITDIKNKTILDFGCNQEDFCGNYTMQHLLKRALVSI